MSDFYDSFAELDAFLEYLSELSEQDRMMVLDPIRFNEFKYSCVQIEKIARKTSPDAKIEITDNSESNIGMGTMTIETDEFVAKDIQKFIGALQFVSNIEFYPLTNGNIKIGVSFNGVWKEHKPE